MLETIREFAQERLNELPEANALRQAHADTLLVLAETVNQEDVSAEVDLLNRLKADHANFRQAIGYYTSQGPAASSSGCDSWPPSPISGGRTGISPRAVASWRRRSRLLATFQPRSVRPRSRARHFSPKHRGTWTGRTLNEQVLALLRRRVMWPASRTRDRARCDRPAAGRLEVRTLTPPGGVDAWRQAGDAAGTAGALLDLGLIRQPEGDHAARNRR